MLLLTIVMYCRKSYETTNENQTTMTTFKIRQIKTDIKIHQDRNRNIFNVYFCAHDKIEIECQND